MTLKEYRALLEERIDTRAKWSEGVFDENRLECAGEIRAFAIVLRDLEKLGSSYIPRHENTGK